MAKPILIEERPIHLVALKDAVESIKKRDKELGVATTKTEEYLQQFVSISPKKAEELEAKLKALRISRLKEEFIIKIIDTLPATVEDLKTLLQGYVVSINQKDMKKVVDIIKGFVK